MVTSPYADQHWFYPGQPKQERARRDILAEMIDDLLQRLAHELPEQAETIRRIGQVRKEAFGRPYEEFFEPKSVFEISEKGSRLIAPSLPDVQAWAKHVAHGARARMLSIEPPLLAAVANDSLTPAMILLRSLAETAGMACLVLLTLKDAEPRRLRDVMQRTLFGSALKCRWKPFSELSDLLPFSESAPPQAKELMDALDRFVASGARGNGRYQAAYGLMCEFAHPNSRGVLGFARSVEVPVVGWQVRYTSTEEVGVQDKRMALSLLLEMMRLGYAAAELLRLGTVIELADGFSIADPEPQSLSRVLRRLMLLEDEPENSGHVI